MTRKLKNILIGTAIAGTILGATAAYAKTAISIAYADTREASCAKAKKVGTAIHGRRINGVPTVKGYGNCTCNKTAYNTWHCKVPIYYD